jgi:ectoine hydroxylase-related dioxygenase (phytanoyl-CoA dioxygenase family)
LLKLLSKPVAGAKLHAESAAEHGPTSGLVVLAINVEAEATMSARLRVSAGDAVAFEKAVQLEPEPRRFWLGLHGQLLPNGPVKIRLELVGARGAVLSERVLSLHIRNEGQVAEQVRASLEARGVPLVLDGVCDSGDYDYADPALTAWFDRGPAEVELHLAELESAGSATPDELAALRHFCEKGFLVLPNAINAEQLARINAAVDDAVEKKIEGYQWGSSQRIHNLHEQYPAIRDLWLHPTILRMLTLIFEVPPQPCQSLTYVFGSQQEHHQDTIHLTPFPAGRMCGVWTALEDVQPSSGELVVFPGSHKLDRVYMRTVNLPKIVNDDWIPFQQNVVERWTEMIVKSGLGREFYRPKAGSVLIWHENLMHAGSPRIDMEKSRRSIVGHYFAHGAIVYYDSSGLPGALYQGEAV